MNDEYIHRQHDRDTRRGRHILALILILGVVICGLAVSHLAKAASATLTCTPPTQNVDGTPLTDLAGIRWLYGASTTALTPVKTTPACATTIDNLTAGTWYFAAKAFNTAGIESAQSNVSSKTIAAAAVDCAVSAYGAWSAPAWSTCVNGTQTRQEMRTRTILTQPSNGGTVCPALTETRTASQSCAVPILLTTGGSVWVAQPNWTTFSWKLGSAVGTIPPKMKCDATRKIGSEYFRVTAPITWAGSRKDYVVARCALQ